MQKSTMRFLATLLCVWTLLFPVWAKAETYESLYNWRFEGAQPSGRLVFYDNAYWGTTYFGGSLSTSVTSFAGAGTAFRLTPAGELTILRQFGGAAGLNPEGGLTLGSDGAFYGLSQFGGTGSQSVYSGGNGVIYKLTPSGAGSTVFNFGGTFDVGANPVGELIERAPGKFLGLNTPLTGNKSLLFEISPSPFSYVKRGDFFESGPGKAGSGLIKAADDSFYGTTRNAIVRMGVDNVVSVLKTFSNFNDGSDFRPGLAQGADGRLYGVAESGGANSKGVVWVMNLDGSGYTVLHHFAGADGEAPRCRLLPASDGSLYGTTRSGGTDSKGTLFKITTAGLFTKLHDFHGLDGADPRTLIEVSGKLAGVAAAGGSTGKGLVFEASFAGAIQIVKELGNPAGHIPSGPLLFASDGNAYGALAWGGPVNAGAIYRRTASGAVELVHAFKAGEGLHPQYPLVEGNDGALYGVTAGAFGTPQGSVFRVAKDGGSFSELHAFSITKQPFGAARGPLVPRPDGKLVGMNWQGGSSDPVLYRIGPNSGYAEIHHYTTDQLRAASGRIFLDEAGAAWFIGHNPAANSGAGGLALYRVTKAGVTSIVANTSSTELLAGPTQGADGAFYFVAATNIGGAPSLMKITPQGVASSAAILSSGNVPSFSIRGDLVEREPGHLFLTSSTAGANATLTHRVHELQAATGVLSELKEFPSLNADVRAFLTQFIGTGTGGTAVPGGIFVDPALSLSPDGSLYGSVPQDTAQAGGELFRINLAPRAGTLPAAQTGTASNIDATTAAIAGEGNANGAQSYGYIEFGPSTKYGYRTFPLDLGAANAVIPLAFELAALAPGTTYHYRAAAVSAGGISYGADQTFTTLPNAAPAANADSISIRIPGAPQPRAIPVLANDSDPEHATLVIESYTQPSRGTLTLASGIFSYTPAAGFNADDSFSYTITDGISEATALVTIHAVLNSAPIVVEDNGVVRAKSKVSIDVLANDSDPDGDVITLKSFTNSSFGSVTQEGNLLVYTPGKFFAGTDSFAYTASDSLGAMTTGNVIVRDPFLLLKGSYSAIVSESSLVNVTVSPTGVLTGSVKTSTGKSALKGTLSIDGTFSQTIKRAGKPDLVVHLQFNSAIPAVSGSLDGVAFGPAAILATGLPPGLVANKLTARAVPTGVVPAELDSEAWAAGNLSSRGVLSLAGQMPDGTPFSLSGQLQRDGKVSILRSSPAASFYLVLAFEAKSQTDFTGTLHWSRVGVGKGFFPGPIDVRFDVAGARFLPAQRESRTLSYSIAAGGKANVEVELSGGDLTPQQALDIGIRYSVSAVDILLPDEPTNPGQLKLTVNRKSGLFSGSFKHPALDSRKPPVLVKGVLLQALPGQSAPNLGIGNFRGPSHSGRVQLVPQ